MPGRTGVVAGMTGQALSQRQPRTKARLTGEHKTEPKRIRAPDRYRSLFVAHNRSYINYIGRCGG